MANRSCTSATEGCAFAPPTPLLPTPLVQCLYCGALSSILPASLLSSPPPSYPPPSYASWLVLVGSCSLHLSEDCNCYASLSWCVIDQCAWACCSALLACFCPVFTRLLPSKMLTNHQCSLTPYVCCYQLFIPFTHRASSSSLWQSSVRSGSLTHCVTSMTHSQSHK